MQKTLKTKRFLVAFAIVISMIFQLLPVTAYAADKKETEANKEVNIPIVSFNDFHGSLQGSTSDPGAAKFVNEIKNFKSENPNTIVVSGGDLYQGSALSNLLQGKPVSDMVKELGVTYSAIGNHEFDWGRNLFNTWSKDGGFEFLASNVYYKGTDKPIEGSKPYGIVEKDGKKIGFIGLSTPETAYKTSPNSVKDIEFRNPKKYAEKWTEYLKNEKHVDAVIILCHMASYQDEKGNITGEVEELTKVKGIDAIISAHSHQKVCGKLNGVPIVQAYKNGRSIGHVNLHFDSNGKLTVSNSRDDIYKRINNLKEDKIMKEDISKYEKELAPIMDEKVTYLSENLPHNRDTGITPLGMTVSQTMKELTNADIALMNGGGVRAPLYKGNITVGDLYRILPFDNTLVTLDLKGSDVIKALDHGIEPKDFGWGQYAGVKVFYNKGAKEGEKITKVQLANGKDIDPNQYYKVVTNDFMAAGGDGYDFKNAKNIKDTNLVLRDSMKDKWAKEGIKPITNMSEFLVQNPNGNSETDKNKDPNSNNTSDKNNGQDLNNKDNNINSNKNSNSKEQSKKLETLNKDNKVIALKDYNSAKNNKNNSSKDISEMPKTGMEEDGFILFGLMIVGCGIVVLRRKDKKVS